MAPDQLSRVFAALADPTRREIVARLALGDASVAALAAPFDMSMQAVSKHLKVLEDAGLISTNQDAQRRPRHLEAAVLDQLTTWIDRYRRQAEERFQRLDALLAEMADPSAVRGGAPTGAATRPSAPLSARPHPRSAAAGTPDVEGAPS